jgi:dynamin GTPase
MGDSGTRTVGVISKVDQAASDRRSLDAVEALLSGQGPSVTLDIPWVALVGQSVSIAAAHAGSVSADDSLETAWRAEAETLKSILSRASPIKLGRVALVETLAAQMRKRLIQRLPNLLSGYFLFAFSTVICANLCFSGVGFVGIVLNNMPELHYHFDFVEFN